jgi:translation initiation factor IF-2
MLCFDVKIDKEAQQYAEEVGVKIFSAEIIYHLFDNFTAHQKVLSFFHRSPIEANEWRTIDNA